MAQSTADELAKLAALKEQGALSDQEFKKAKQAVLGQIGRGIQGRAI